MPGDDREAYIALGLELAVDEASGLEIEACVLRLVGVRVRVRVSGQGQG